jgi:hypothetical protein
MEAGHLTRPLSVSAWFVPGVRLLLRCGQPVAGAAKEFLWRLRKAALLLASYLT